MRKNEQIKEIMHQHESETWFAMRATYQRELEAENYLNKHSVKTFIPMHYRMVVRGKYKRRESVPIIRSLIFVYTTPSKLQSVKKDIQFLQYMTDTRSHEKITIPDNQMNQFIAVAGTYNDHLLYFAPEEVNLSRGTRVRICGGEFEGREGVFVKVKGSRDKRVVIAIQGIIAVAMATIHPELIMPINN